MKTSALGRRIARRVRRWRGAEDDDEPAASRRSVLDDVQRRLELVLRALYERPFRIEPAPEPRPPSWVWRLLGAQRPAPSLATHAGDTIRLPRHLSLDAGEDALAQWRLLALEQAERVVRGSATLVAATADPLERTLFALAEGVCVDQALATRTRAAATAVRAARMATLAGRAPFELLPAAERDVELIIRAVLAADPAVAEPTSGGHALPNGAGDPQASLAWARATATRLRAVHGDVFRAVPPVGFWGELPLLDAALAERPHDGRGFTPPLTLPGLLSEHEHESRDSYAPNAMRPLPNTHAPRPGAEAPPNDTRAPLVAAAADAPASHDARDRPARPSAPPVDDEAPPPNSAAGHGGTNVVRLGYPEWDAIAGRYRPHGATVLLARAPEGDGGWAEAILRDHAALVRRVRERFEPLRARRARLARQTTGEELDLAACVDAYVDRRAGRPRDDRLYVAVRPARRALAIAIVVDVSGSTDAPVSPGLRPSSGETRQIIDVEKEALILATEALEALGDPFTVLTFSSRGAHAVRLTTIKDFAERTDATVRRRIAAMRPVGNTRLGAAVRHATALLTRQPVGHRLLLLLSDGRPNDADGYQGPYATEDARRAILEARASGVHPYCLTVDREEAEYLPHIFGPGGHTLLRDVEQLPLALVGAVRQLLGAGH